MNRLILVSNRLPVTAEINDENTIEIKESAGGLATGLNSLEIDLEMLWIGWSGTKTGSHSDQVRISTALHDKNCLPVFLTEEQHHLYYEGFSNEILWPLFHYFIEFAKFENEYWEAYKEVNLLFAEKVKEVATEGDIIWVHDYHLMLLPELLRKDLPNHQIGFFLHIPFPTHELFRICPWEKELLRGVLGADLIGFHTYGYMHHFITSATKALHLKSGPDHISFADRSIQIDAFPMGINYEKFQQAGESEEVKAHLKDFRKIFGQRKLILTVDRLDYSKGIIHRLRAYEQLLELSPELEGKISLIMLVVPSRATIGDYQHLKEEIDEAVGRINGLYGKLGWIPVHYLYRSVPFEQLSALYNLADVALVTPLRDGMNLVAKEYVASRNEDGVLILSKMAGASCELKTALSVNPMDDREMVKVMMKAISMPEKEQADRMIYMQKLLRANGVEKWASRFINILKNNYTQESLLKKQMANGTETARIREAFAGSKAKILFLKYDGTLVPFFDNPLKAEPDHRLLKTLKSLCRHATIVLISGRDHQILEKWFGKLPVEMVAEHGMWQKSAGKWETTEVFNSSWKRDIRPLLDEFTDNTPLSFIEDKEFSLAWHYRRTDSWLAEIRVPQLIESLINPTTNLNLEVLNGDKIVEIKCKSADKGKAIGNWLNRGHFDFVMAIGDDASDERMFENLPQQAFSIKVGKSVTSASFRFEDWKKVRTLLSELTRLPKIHRSIIRHKRNVLNLE